MNKNEIELLEKLHKEINNTGNYNTYLVTENVDCPSDVYMQVMTSKKEVSEDEKKSFIELSGQITICIQQRTKKFTEE